MNESTSSPTTRREFIKTTGRFPAASALAGVALPQVHAAVERGHVAEHVHGDPAGVAGDARQAGQGAFSNALGAMPWVRACSSTARMMCSS